MKYMSEWTKGTGWRGIAEILIYFLKIENGFDNELN